MKAKLDHLSTRVAPGGGEGTHRGAAKAIARKTPSTSTAEQLGEIDRRARTFAADSLAAGGRGSAPGDRGWRSSAPHRWPLENVDTGEIHRYRMSAPDETDAKRGCRSASTRRGTGGAEAARRRRVHGRTPRGPRRRSLRWTTKRTDRLLKKGTPALFQRAESGASHTRLRQIRHCKCLICGEPSMARISRAFFDTLSNAVTAVGLRVPGGPARFAPAGCSHLRRDPLAVLRLFRTAVSCMSTNSSSTRLFSRREAAEVAGLLPCSHTGASSPWALPWSRQGRGRLPGAARQACRRGSLSTPEGNRGERQTTRSCSACAREESDGGSVRDCCSSPRPPRR